MSFLGPLIGAASSLLGGILGNDQSDKNNKAQIAQAQANLQQQREFAQNGVQWRAEDARKAGIHPLAALGAQTASFAPVALGLDSTNHMGTAVAGMGQDLSRAIDATRTSDQRSTAVAESAQKLQLQNMGLQNELLAAQIARARQTITPSFPGPSSAYVMPGQPAPAGIQITPSEQEAADAGGARAAAQPPSHQYFNEGGGRFSLQMSPQMKTATEDSFLAEVPWHVSNRVIPPAPPRGALRPGESWQWSPFRQSWIINTGTDYGLANPHPKFDRYKSYDTSTIGGY